MGFKAIELINEIRNFADILFLCVLGRAVIGGRGYDVPSDWFRGRVPLSRTEALPQLNLWIRSLERRNESQGRGFVG